MAAKRKDPPKRSEPLVWNSLQNEDPKRHYVWAYTGHFSGVDTYEALGYEVETYQTDGVLPSGKRFTQDMTGHRIERNGHVLMSCSAERKMELQQYGSDGQSGWELAKKLEDKTKSRRYGQEALGAQGRLRGSTNSPYFTVVNEAAEQGAV